MNKTLRQWLLCISFGKLLIVYHIYQKKHIWSPPIFVSLRSFAVQSKIENVNVVAIWGVGTSRES